ncbi:MAG TPA: hypothetical protein VHO72_08070 [Bacteroidales bacterium]|nr:hypothetical protein [Bacteroidales bacterium]
MVLRRIFLVLLVTGATISYSYCQENQNVPDIERYIDKPLTLHKNNLELGLGYQFGALTNIYDNNGHIVADEGIAASNYAVNTQLTYGITERLQLQTLVNYLSYTRRIEPVLQSGVGLNPVTYTQGILNYKGLIDPNFNIKYLLLTNKHKVSIAIGGGISLPVAKYKPEKPTIDAYIYNKYTIGYNFLYTNHNGLGTAVYNLNCAIKLRLGDSRENNSLSKIIVRLYTDYYTAPATVSTNDWHYVFDAGDPNGYTLQSLPLKHKEGDWLSNKLLVDWQAFNITSFQIGGFKQVLFSWVEPD